MRGVFEDDDLDIEQGRQRHETELTLTSTTLLAIFFGMVLLCGLFFGLGFAVGRYGPGESTAANQPSAASASPASPAGSSRPKPSASAQNPPEPPRTVVNLPSAETSTSTPGPQNPEAAPAPAT